MEPADFPFSVTTKTINELLSCICLGQRFKNTCRLALSPAAPFA